MAERTGVACLGSTAAAHGDVGMDACVCICGWVPLVRIWRRLHREWDYRDGTCQREGKGQDG